ncbi:hypothetical protein ABZ137_39535 [Streptomyces bobili]
MVALKPRNGVWAPADQPHTPIEAAHALTWRDARRPGDWTPVERHFRDGHTETWWVADARLAGYGPNSPGRLIVATTDPASLPEKATWYLAPTCPTLTHPTSPPARTRRPTLPRSSASTDLLAVDVPVTPAGILPRQTQHENADRAHGTRPTRTFGPGTGRMAAREKITVPAHHRARPHQQPHPAQQLPWQAMEERRKSARDEPHSPAVGLALQYPDLMAQSEDLDIFLPVAHRQQSPPPF